MRIDLPTSHVEEAMKLEATALVELFQIEMKAPGGAIVSLYICPQKTLTWQGKTWANNTPCTISETSMTAGGEVTRPKMSIVNPNGLWSRYVHQRYTDNAIFRRYRVLRSDIDANINSFHLSLWRASKIVSLSKNTCVIELRTALDGHNFKIPADTYRPPNYPAVSVA